MAGRPRKRSVDETLEIATRLFWERGYRGVSVNDLCEALGVGPSSLYNTFGSKEALYARCLERYVESHGGFMRDALLQERAPDALIAVLRGAADQYTCESSPRGCAVISADEPIPPGTGPDPRALRRATLHTIEARIRRGVDEGQITADTDPEALARFIFGVLQGMSAQARDGADRESLLAMLAPAEDAVRARATLKG